MPESTITPSIGVVFITHNAVHHLRRSLPPFLNSPLKPRVLVVNSTSNDGTVELAQELGAEVLVVPRRTFNHGSTREKARKYLNTDIVVMVTPDAYADDPLLLEKLVAPLIKKEASITYARQLPHDGAGIFEAFPRSYNYPDKSHHRTIDSINTYGAYTFFCSDSCAAYLNSALDEVEGFPTVLLGEDTVVVAKLLRKGHTIAYVADATIKHSHGYSLKQEFQRHFDTGLARKGYQELLACSDTKRGMGYVKALMTHLVKEKPALVPYALLQTTVKFIGYHTGRLCTNAPLAIKKIFTSQDFYWESDAYTKG